ncbi:MAG: substrate-binding domain-containing protein [Gammaproteobacteria bacterium]
MPRMIIKTAAKTIAAAVMIAAIAFAVFFAADNNTLRIAATTSVHNAGLLESLIPAFEKECECRVHVVVAGTGKALKLGEQGDVDMLLVHAPESEEQYVKDGHGIGRQTIMHNAFVLAGPPNDPAAVKQAGGIAEAMKIIATKRAPFISRGDDSGTHKKEMQLWRQSQAADINGKWRIRAGAGMGRALLMADQLRAYILSDSATFAALRDKTDLRIITTDNPPLKNEYSIIIINPARHPQTNTALARRFGKWLLSPRAQGIIAAHQKFGERLFSPVRENRQ